MSASGTAKLEVKRLETTQMLSEMEDFCGRMKTILGAIGIERRQVVKCFAEVSEADKQKLGTVLRKHSDNRIVFSFHNELPPDVFSAAICRITPNKIEVKLP